ncbi:MAG: ABC transporter permease subunit [Oscillospiraceae bacterium]
MQNENTLTNKQALKIKKRKALVAYFKDNYDLYLFLIPTIILIFIFCYVPLYGIQIAFKDFSPRKGITGSDWIGFSQFIRFFDSAYFGLVMKNTILLSVYQLIASFPVPIILALLLNSMGSKKYKKIIQTVTYAPNFISVVVICGMLLIFLSPRNGIVNSFLAMFGVDPINFIAHPEYFRSIYVWSGVWQSAGFSSIIYMAALSGISPELHEAAVVDGATKLQRIINIDLPGILPTATILLIMSFGGLISIGFEKAYLLQNSLNAQTSEIISTYTYKIGLVDNDLGFSTAIGLFNSAINCVLLIAVNYISRKISETSLW